MVVFVAFFVEKRTDTRTLDGHTDRCTNGQSLQFEDASRKREERNRIREKRTNRTRPDTRHKMRLVCVLFTFENNTGQMDGWTDGPTQTDL